MLKWDPALFGCTLYVATPVTSRSERFFAVKNARVVSPGRTRTLLCVGTNLHGILGDVGVERDDDLPVRRRRLDRLRQVALLREFVLQRPSPGGAAEAGRLAEHAVQRNGGAGDADHADGEGGEIEPGRKPRIPAPARFPRRGARRAAAALASRFDEDVDDDDDVAMARQGASEGGDGRCGEDGGRHCASASAARRDAVCRGMMPALLRMGLRVWVRAQPDLTSRKSLGSVSRRNFLAVCALKASLSSRRSRGTRLDPATTRRLNRDRDGQEKCVAPANPTFPSLLPSRPAAARPRL